MNKTNLNAKGIEISDLEENLKKLSKLEEKNKKLENDLVVFYNIVQLNSYVNAYIRDDSLMSIINDAILGVLGAQKSRIFIIDNGELILKATSVYNDDASNLCYQSYIEEGKGFLEDIDNDEEKFSVLGVPVKIGETSIGYIALEHPMHGVFTESNKLFLEALVNQIAMIIENAKLYKRIQNLAEKDPLLGIYNRRTFVDIVEKRISKAEQFAIIMIDLDNFKSINDTLGHQFGDKVLVETVEKVVRNLGEKDIVSRYGGEEIIIYIDDIVSKREVFEKIERIRIDIQDNDVIFEGVTRKVTASFGLSFSNLQINSLFESIKFADELLYEAKKQGKNRVAVAKNELD